MRLKRVSIKNFRSFYLEQSIDFEKNGNVKAIFGPNGSGKTNFLLAIQFMQLFIRHSTSYNGRGDICERFALRQNANKESTAFSMHLVEAEYEYIYSFTLSNNKVERESLKRGKIGENSQPVFETIFSRPSIKNGSYDMFGFTKELLSETRDDALILTIAYERNNKYAMEIFDCLEKITLLFNNNFGNETAKFILKNPAKKAQVLWFLHCADLYIQDIKVSEVKIPEDIMKQLPIRDDIKKDIGNTAVDVRTTHFIYNDAGRIVGLKEVSLLGNESAGTQKLFELAYFILKAIENGEVLYIDDFEAFLHPREAQFIIECFMNKSINKNDAQLIINTHNDKIMNIVGKKNIYLFGKNGGEATVVSTLPADIRNDDTVLDKKYMGGRFGAIPNTRVMA